MAASLVTAVVIYGHVIYWAKTKQRGLFISFLNSEVVTCPNLALSASVNWADWTFNPPWFQWLLYSSQLTFDAILSAISYTDPPPAPPHGIGRPVWPQLHLPGLGKQQSILPTRSRVDEKQSRRSFGISGKRLAQRDGSGTSRTDMALKIVKGSIDRMFDKNLQDLVRGIRNHKEDEVKWPPEQNTLTWMIFNLHSLMFSKFADICGVVFVDQLAKRWVNECWEGWSANVTVSSVLSSS